MSTGKTKTFLDRKGNRSIFPSLIIFSDDPNPRSEYDIECEARGITSYIDIKLEDGWLEFDEDNFPHIKGELLSPGFVHGAATSYVFAGPLFDEIANA